MSQQQRKDSSSQTGGRIASLVAALGSEDPVARENARIALVATGRGAVPLLIDALGHRQERVRWEAARALSKISDPEAAPALVRALEDETPGIRWLAAEALTSLSREGLIPLFQALIRRSDSVRLRQGAHHICRALASGPYAQQLAAVREALESPAPIVALPVAAFNALKEL
jgi:HEAT repeat protein